MNLNHLRKGKQVTFPNVMRNAVKCPTCREGVQGMLVYEGADPPVKFLLPCRHLLTEVEETKIVTDMYRRGL